MASKKLGCPLSSIFQQRKTQIQNKQVCIESQPTQSQPSYRILFETSYSLKARITAAEPIKNPYLYEQAGLRTPSESAIRDIHGERAWILRLLKLAVEQQQNSPLGDASTRENESIIFLATKNPSRDSSVINELPEDVRRKVHVMYVASQHLFERDESGDNADDSTPSTFTNLGQLYQTLQETLTQCANSGRGVTLIWQSLTPLIMAHGFLKVIRFLCSLRNCLQIWHVNSSVTTPKQLMQLEDASNAVLHLSGGEMNILRHGIREQGNILRQKLPFQLEAVVGHVNENRRFRVVEKLRDDEVRNEDNDKIHSRITTNIKNNGGSQDNVVLGEKIESSGTSKTDGRSRIAHPRLEESDGGRNESGSRNFSSEKDPATAHRPRIYLQDDDPEFDDFDEEDPDDDLDI